LAQEDQDGRKTELASGGFVFSDSSRPYAIDFIDNFSSAVLRIPRPMLRQRIGAPERFTALRVDGASGLGAMVSSILSDLPGLRLKARIYAHLWGFIARIGGVFQSYPHFTDAEPLPGPALI
jgi:hypothetical protein